TRKGKQARSADEEAADVFLEEGEDKTPNPKEKVTRDAEEVRFDDEEAPVGKMKQAKGGADEAEVAAADALLDDEMDGEPALAGARKEKEQADDDEEQLVGAGAGKAD